MTNDNSNQIHSASEWAKRVSPRQFIIDHGWKLPTEEEQQDRLDIISPTRYEDE